MAHDYGCSNCGISYEQALAYFENYIANALLCGKLQGGIQDCQTDTILPQGSKVVTCEQLKDLINDLLQTDELNIPGIQSLSFEYPNVVLVDQAGTTHSIDLSKLAERGVDSFTLLDGGLLNLSLRDGSDIQIELKPFVTQVSHDSRVLEGHSDSDLNIILTLGDGTQVPVNLGAQFKSLNDAQQDVLKEIMALNKSAILDAFSVAAGKAAVTELSLDNNKQIVLTRGDGTTVKLDTSALRQIDLGRDSPFEWDASGALVFNPERIKWQVIKSLELKDDGLHLQLDNQCDEIVIGIDDFIKVLSGKLKVEVCDQGIITGDGTTANPLCIDLAVLIGLLTDGSADMDALLKKLVIELNRVQGPCTVDIQTVTTDYTLENADSVIISQGGKIVVNANSAVSGRQFTIIQGGDTKVVLTPVGVTIVPPYQGSLTTAGANAVLTLLCVSPTEYRLFGQTEEA